MKTNEYEAAARKAYDQANARAGINPAAEGNIFDDKASHGASRNSLRLVKTDPQRRKCLDGAE